MMATRARTRAERIQKTEVAEAWEEYLLTVRNLAERNYDEVEDWAYARLQTRLRVIERERDKQLSC